ncbi:hypothetical protein R2A130_3170 [Ahrensia sp. R2A130]|nr:hypothetical protein R2A130_3170 [Ahrensia sp. R2A130]
MIRTLALASITVLALTTAAAAGSTTLKKGGKSVSLWCNNSGCYTAEKLSFFKKGPQKRIGPGGAANFRAQKTKMKKAGWK